VDYMQVCGEKHILPKSEDKTLLSIFVYLYLSLQSTFQIIYNSITLIERDYQMQIE
jgi:hypothetical protein